MPGRLEVTVNGDDNCDWQRGEQIEARLFQRKQQQGIELD
jgi:hypothetical protein